MPRSGTIGSGSVQGAWQELDSDQPDPAHRLAPDRKGKLWRKPGPVPAGPVEAAGLEAADSAEAVAGLEGAERLAVREDASETPIFADAIRTRSATAAETGA